MVLVAALPVMGGQLYKWVDADGKVHYSDQPPPGNVRMQETLRPSGTPVRADAAPGADGQPAAAPSTGAKTMAEQEMEFRKRRVEAAEAEAKRQKEEQAAAEKQRNCTQARNQLAALERGGRITRTDANGEQIFLNDAEIAAEIPNARQVADSWCK
ncbi:MAG: DUF4124 domain-containing protein [Burkholderiales bacterium]|nr:DUF4124 domain-containing protein [Burkholderiales bacterium]